MSKFSETIEQIYPMLGPYDNVDNFKFKIDTQGWMGAKYLLDDSIVTGKQIGRAHV